MTNEEFKEALEKTKIFTEKKIEIAKFLRMNNLSIHSVIKPGKDGNPIFFMEIRYDFYEDGDPVVLFSTEKQDDKCDIRDEDLLN